MTSLLLPFLLLASPAPRNPGGDSDDPPSSGFAWVGYSVDPTSVGASVSGPDTVTKNQLFSHSVSMSDSDTFVRSDVSNVYEVKGTSKLLSLDVSPNNGVALGHSGVRVFSQVGIDTTTFSDSSVVKKVNYQASAVAGAPYPLSSTCIYDINDPADAYSPPVPWSGHTKDTPGVTLDNQVTVTL